MAVISRTGIHFRSPIASDLNRYVGRRAKSIQAEPTAALMLTQDYPDILPDADAAAVAANTTELTAFLWELHQAGRLSFDGMITHTFSLDDINPALDLVRAGGAGRVLIDLAGR